MAHKLTNDEISAALVVLPGWTHKDNSLQRDYVFTTFEEALAFMLTCAPAISKHNHHPEWTNVYNKLQVIFRTHDAGNVVTNKDIEMAIILEKLFKNKDLNALKQIKKVGTGRDPKF